ncbi:hypothetical protein ACHAXN_010036 [Cyclotella atomus]
MQSSKLGLISIIASLATLSILSSSIIVRAFQPTIHSTSSIRLNAQPNNQHDEASVSVSTRRNALQKSAGVAFSILLGGTTAASEANASYSAYTRREEDWKQREKNGDIKISSARELRAQLREIAPMNSEGSKIFCPNGPSANVSPLMENKCGDRLALPSVYGRNNDIMGNSIPGFGSVGAANAASISTLREELNAQAYFRE